MELIPFPGNQDPNRIHYLRQLRMAMASREPDSRIEDTGILLSMYVREHHAPNHSKLLAMVAHHIASQPHKSSIAIADALEAYPALETPPYQEMVREAWQRELAKYDDRRKAAHIVHAQQKLSQYGVPRNDAFFTLLDRQWKAIPESIKMPRLNGSLPEQENHLYDANDAQRLEELVAARLQRPGETGLSHGEVEAFASEFQRWQRKIFRGRG